jgi:rhamnose utilization protein RhaD (predicted bifunctional aldolase and dehydrogenase)/NAD(P)-dependent dehydrogenase (short-subunit alcohol dehydrogenase family)
MESRFNPDAADNLVQELAPRASEVLAQRTYTARLVGSEAALVLHGGGNTSVKSTAQNTLGETIPVIHVKGSGHDLAAIGPEGHPAVRLEPLLKLRQLAAMSDEAMVNELRANLLDASAPSPSVETLLHAFLPVRFIDHTHADAILALADQPEGKRIFTEIFGAALVWVPYVMPGFALAKRCIEAFDEVAARGVDPEVMVLEKHGLFTWGDTAKESYERTIDAVTRAENYIGDQNPTVSIAHVERVTVPESQVLPRLRGALAKLEGAALERGPIVRTRSTPRILSFLDRRDASELVARGCATPDHALRTKPTALFVPSPGYTDADHLALQLERAIGEYGRKYDAYFEEMCEAKGVAKTKLDPWPRVVLLPGFGACAIGATAREADVALDIYEHTIDVMVSATDVGRYAPCTRSELFDVEYWSLEQAKIKHGVKPRLGKCIAVVTGAASGIGFATAAHMLAAGAHVAMVDVDFDLLAGAIGRLSAYKDRALMVIADVRDVDQIAAAFARTAAAWGGVDVVVSNAGSAPEGRLDTSEGEASLRDSMELNCFAHARVARAGVEIMSAQGRGGCLAFNASKSAFNPGPGFGPYAVAKSALVALMRQYAVDLGSRGIRSNAVNADRVRTQLFAGGVLESRAKARGLTPDEYFKANLLSREVAADDVADAFIFLATAKATTGCVLTVDGGNAAAFPR